MPARGETEGTLSATDEAVHASAPAARPASPEAVDLSEAAYHLINDQAGHDAPAPNQLGFVVAGAFLATAIIVLLTLKQGADSRQLLIGVILLAVVNLPIAIFWSRRKIHSE